METNHSPPMVIDTSVPADHQLHQLLETSANRDRINALMAKARRIHIQNVIHASKKKAARRKANKVAALHRRKNRA